MTQSPLTSPEAGGNVDAAKEQAARVASDAQDRAADVAGTAKEQASRVASEAAGQLQQLAGQAGEQLDTQAAEQVHRLSEYLHRSAGELQHMADAGEADSIPRSLVADLARRSTDVAEYLAEARPRQLVDDLQSFGRRRPAAFLAAAAVAGVVVGRLGKSVKNASPKPAGRSADVSDPYPPRSPAPGVAAGDMIAAPHAAPAVAPPLVTPPLTTPR